MRKPLNLLIILFTLGLSAQDLTELNKSLSLPDSISQEEEIRIYKGFGITNFTSIFRMYKDNSDKWNIEHFEHFAGVKKRSKPEIKKQKLTSKDKPELVWLNILRTNIQFLPEMSEIKWKMKKRGKIEEINNKPELSWSQVQIMDGVGYVVQIKENGKYHETYYGNPEKYLEHYPDVDELDFFSEFINLIRTEFDIWKK